MARNSSEAGKDKSPLPHQIKPQLATLVERSPDGDDWIHEIKFDGYRVMARLVNGAVRLYTRNGHDWTHRFPEIAAEVALLPTAAALLDGEVVAQQANGTSSFGDLQDALSRGRTARLVFQLFDLPYLETHDLTGSPLCERKRALQGLIVSDRAEEWPRLRYTEHIEGQGEAFFEHGCRVGLEGIISKRANAPYQPGRSKSWLKVKCTHHEEFVVGGFTEPSGSRGGFGALLLGAFDDKGELHYTGRVGTGFNNTQLTRIHRMLQSIEEDQSPFADPLPGPTRTPAHWVRPEIVIEVEYAERTRDGVLRHAAFRGLREDRDAGEIQRDPSEAG